MGDKKYDWDTFVQNAKNFEIRKVPCLRDSLLNGIGLATGIALFRFVRTKHIASACNYAVGTFLLTTVGSFEYCRYQRTVRREKIKQTLEILNERERELENMRRSGGSGGGSPPSG
eukprot:m.64573 g.64573  ORF g.64573 m.64573 type:complete len:116 (+) comp13932_c0_seq7:316-663(+)